MKCHMLSITDDCSIWSQDYCVLAIDLAHSERSATEGQGLLK